MIETVITCDRCSEQLPSSGPVVTVELRNEVITPFGTSYEITTVDTGTTIYQLCTTCVVAFHDWRRRPRVTETRKARKK